MPVTRTRNACPLDCPDACRLTATVEDGRVTVLDGTPEDVGDGYICAKVRRFPQLMTHESRVCRPLLRVGTKGKAEFREVSWDRALELLVERIQAVRTEFGGEAILPPLGRIADAASSLQCFGTGGARFRTVARLGIRTCEFSGPSTQSEEGCRGQDCRSDGQSPRCSSVHGVVCPSTF